jgi:ligand-binding sensor domain-containing protein
MKTKCSKVFLLAVILCGFGFSFERIANFASCISVYDFESNGDSLYVASSGGVYIFNKSSGTGHLLPSNTRSPDPLTKSLCLQGNQILWSGTNQGYLSKRTPPDNLNSISTFSSYVSTQWKILDLLLFGKSLLIASDKGISVFNTEKGYSEKSASKFTSLSSSQVNVIKIYNDTLYAGLNQGVVKLRKKLSSKTELDSANFFDPTIWDLVVETAKPVKSLVYDKILKPYSCYADIFNGHIISGEDSLLLLDNVIVQKLPSRITALKVTGYNECWIGTEENYFLLWNGNTLTSFDIPGPTMSSVGKVYVDHTGKMWYLPLIDGMNPPWWLGVGAYENEQWKLYNKNNYPDFGVLNDNPENSAIIETKDNRIWFGTSGGQVKTYNPVNNSWRIYHVNSYENGSFYSGNSVDNWGKCDAFAIDSSGFLWISSWQNDSGSLICYDYHSEPDESKSSAQEAHFRRFFPGRNYNFTCINVDKQGKILIGDELGKVIVFQHDGNPLENGIQITGTFSIDNAKIYDALTISENNSDLPYASTGNHVKIIATNGLYNYTDSIGYIDNKIHVFWSKLKKDEDFSTNVRTIEAENDNIVWFGTAGEGLIRYDITSEKTEHFTTAHGLISNNIRDLFFDKKNGYLWIATDIGFSKMDVGYSLNKKLKAEDVEVFPNPYSKSKMSQNSITIRNVPSGGNVIIYNVNGQITAKPKLERQENGSLYSWKPANSIVPGTYIIAIKNGNRSGSKVLLIAP